MKKGLFGSLKVLLTDLSHSVTSRKGPALVAVVAADALLGPFLRPEGQFLVVRLKKISHLTLYDCFASLGRSRVEELYTATRERERERRRGVAR